MDKKITNITMDDVAKYCRLSKATISRAVNNPEKVSAKTRATIEEAFRKLGYSYNPLAASLTKNTMNILGVMAGSIRETTYALTISSIQAAAVRYGMNVFFSISDFDSVKEAAILKTFRQYKSAAVIIIGAGEHCERNMAEQLGDELPHVVLWENYEHSSVNYIGIDPEMSMLAAVKHLAELGHQRIGLVLAGGRFVRRAAMRVDGFRKAMDLYGLSFDPTLVHLLNEGSLQNPSAIDAGKRTMQEFLQTEHRPTAVLFPTGTLTLGGIVALQEHGLSYPADMSIMCLGDDDITRNVVPSVTALDSHMETVLELAEQFVLHVGDKTAANMRWQHTLMPRLQIRNSTAAPSQN